MAARCGAARWARRAFRGASAPARPAHDVDRAHVQRRPVPRGEALLRRAWTSSGAPPADPVRTAPSGLAPRGTRAATHRTRTDRPRELAPSRGFAYTWPDS